MKTSTKVAFIIPFLNDLPLYAHLFFRSVELNTCINVLLFAERQPSIRLPSNVHLHLISRNDLLNRIRLTTKLEINSLTGHKL